MADIKDSIFRNRKANISKLFSFGFTEGRGGTDGADLPHDRRKLPAGEEMKRLDTA